MTEQLANVVTDTPTGDLTPGGDLEYKSLRDEILQRINLRQQLMWYALLLSGGLAGFGLEAEAPRVALLYPPFALCLALAWMQNDHRIQDISWYLRRHVEPRFVTPGWETTIKERRDTRGTRVRRTVVLSHGGVFLVTQVIALIIGATTPEQGLLDRTLLSVGVASTAGVLWIARESSKNRISTAASTR